MIPVHYAAVKDREDVVEIFYKSRPETMTQPNDVRTVLEKPRKFDVVARSRERGDAISGRLSFLFVAFNYSFWALLA